MTDDGSASTDTREGDEAAAGDAEPKPDSKAETDDSEWRFALSDLKETSDEDKESNVAGPIATRGPLEPGAINRENALFVLLGVLLVVGLLASIVVGF